LFHNFFVTKTFSGAWQSQNISRRIILHIF
jgi:hypothetical protein